MEQNFDPNLINEEGKHQVKEKGSKRQSLKEMVAKMHSEEIIGKSVPENMIQKSHDQLLEIVLRANNYSHTSNSQKKQNEGQIPMANEQLNYSSKNIIVEIPAQTEGTLVDTNPEKPAQRRSDRIANRRKQLEQMVQNRSLSPINKRLQPKQSMVNKPDQSKSSHLQS